MLRIPGLKQVITLKVSVGKLHLSLAETIFEGNYSDLSIVGILSVEFVQFCLEKDTCISEEHVANGRKIMFFGVQLI